MANVPYAGQVERGIAGLDGSALTGIVVAGDYELDLDHATAADVVSFESEGDGYTRLSGTVSVERIGDEWVLFLDDITSTDLSDEPDRAGVVWVAAGGSDAARSTVFFAPDPGGEIDPYTPTYDDGAFSLLIESVARRLVPDPLGPDQVAAGMYARVKADRSGWEATEVVAEVASVSTLADADVTTVPPEADDVLVWDPSLGASGKWRPGAMPAGAFTIDEVAAVAAADAIDGSGDAFTPLRPNATAEASGVIPAGWEASGPAQDEATLAGLITSFLGGSTTVFLPATGRTYDVTAAGSDLTWEERPVTASVRVQQPNILVLVDGETTVPVALEEDLVALEEDLVALEEDLIPQVEHFTTSAVEISTPRFDLGAPPATDYASGTYATTPPISQFTAGFWAEAVIEIDESRFITSPDEGEQEYLEITSQAYTAGDEGADIFEFAVESIWTGAQWRHFLYYEHVPIGASTDSFKVFGRTQGGLELPTGTPIRVAVWVEFDTGSGQSRARLLTGAPEGRVGLSAAGRSWRIDVEATGPATSMEENDTDAWWIGAGFGRLLVTGVTIRNGGPGGTIVASPDAADAWAEGEGEPFEDAQANTWTPAVNADLVAAPSGSGAVDSVNGETGVVVLDASDVGAAPADKIRTKVLAAAETASSDTLVTSEVALSVVASSAYAFEYHGLLDAANARDGKIQFIGPAGATITGFVMGPRTDAASLPVGVQALGSVSATPVAFGTVGAGTQVPVVVHGSIVTAGTPGDLTVQFAQNNIGSGDVTHGAGSRLVLIKE